MSKYFLGPLNLKQVNKGTIRSVPGSIPTYHVRRQWKKEAQWLNKPALGSTSVMH